MLPKRELAKPELAFFAIADISGYTSFLSSVELDHAQDILADLLDTVVKGLRPPFRLAKFEGDAAFVYAVADKVDGSLLQDVVESTYFRFRRRLRSIKQASSCECDACAAMDRLDLKFVVHHGEMVKQKIGGRDELAGRDVILVHRLLKNSVGETTGGRAYALYSDACIRAMGVDPVAQELTAHGESVDGIGEVKLWHRDLDAAWQREGARARAEVTREDAHVTWDFDIALPRPVVWEHFTVPGNRAKWQPTDAVIEHARKGRRGVGTENHCMHGKDALIEEVLDWRPSDYFTLSILVPAPGAPKIVATYAMEDRPEGATHLEIRVAKPKPKDVGFVDQVGAHYKEDITQAIDRLPGMLQQQPASAAAIDEPPLVSSGARFLTEPVTSRKAR